MASISFRRWIKWGEDQEPSAEECIVLTSPKSEFVDIRWTKTKSTVETSDGKGDDIKRELVWAFAGTSSYSEGRGSWTHWIDSQSDNPAKDEGSIEEKDGLTIEKGTMVNPETGKETPYTELWVPCPPVVKVGQSDPICFVYEAESEEKSTQGRIIRVGGLCLGILKRNGETTAGIWQLGLPGYGVRDEIKGQTGAEGVIDGAKEDMKEERLKEKEDAGELDADTLSEKYLLSHPTPSPDATWQLRLEHGDITSIPAFLPFVKDEMSETAVQPSALEVSLSQFPWQGVNWKRKD